MLIPFHFWRASKRFLLSLAWTTDSIAECGSNENSGQGDCVIQDRLFMFDFDKYMLKLQEDVKK